MGTSASQMQTRWNAAFAVLIGAVLLSIPSVLNGFPFFFNDSGDYLVLHPQLYRSPFYGLLLTGVHMNRFIWGPVVMQCLVASHLVWLLLRYEIGTVSITSFLIVTAILTGVSSLPYFTGFLMPDVFTSIMFVCTYLLAFHFEAMSRPLRIYVFGLACFATSAHLSHWLIEGGFLVAIVGIKAAAASPIGRERAAILLAPIGVALSGFLLFNVVIFGTWSLSTAGPTFLMANLIEYGPARHYLREACPAAGYTMCSVIDELPETANQFLWETGLLARIGGFSGMKAEARQIVAETIRTRPGEVARMIGRNIIAGLFTHEMARELSPSASVPTLPDLIGMKFGPEARRAFMDSAEMRDAIPHRALGLIDDATLLLSFIVLSAAIASAWREARPDRVYLPTSVMAFVLSDTGVCTALSGVYDRYQARVTWLLVLAALIALMQWRIVGEVATE